MRKKTWMRALTALVLFGMAASASGLRAAAVEDKTGKIEIKTVETEGFSMEFFSFGHGPRTLVILPGLSVQSVMGAAAAVAEAYDLLTEEFTIYLFDRRKDLPESYSVQDMARDTAQALWALDLTDVCLFGTSQGGMIAMDIAREYPELAEMLVLGSTAARETELAAKTVGQWVELAEAGDAEGLYLAFGEAVYPRSVFEASRQLLIDAAKSVTAEELARFVVLARGMEGFDVTGGLSEIRCPVLVIGDRDDRVLGAEATEEIAEKLCGAPKVQVYLYDGYGHAAYDTAPDYKERILAFLTGGPVC